jgi:hypothetical protein
MAATTSGSAARGPSVAGEDDAETKGVLEPVSLADLDLVCGIGLLEKEREEIPAGPPITAIFT